MWGNSLCPNTNFSESQKGSGFGYIVRDLNSKPRVPKRKASENDDPPPKPKTTCTDPNQFPRSARDASWGRSRVVRKAHNFYAKGRKEETVNNSS